MAARPSLARGFVFTPKYLYDYYYRMNMTLRKYLSPLVLLTVFWIGAMFASLTQGVISDVVAAIGVISLIFAVIGLLRKRKHRGPAFTDKPWWRLVKLVAVITAVVLTVISYYQNIGLECSYKDFADNCLIKTFWDSLQFTVPPGLGVWILFVYLRAAIIYIIGKPKVEN